MVEVPIKLYVQNLAQKAKAKAQSLGMVPAPIRKKALLGMADSLEERCEEVLEANKCDLEAIPKDLGTTAYRTVLDRIRISQETVQDMAQGILIVADQPDPVGEMTSCWNTIDGIQMARVRVPLGVIGIISEMGPEVTAQSIAICLKTANVCLCRGGKDWFETSKVVAKILQESAEKLGIPEGTIVFLDRPEREGVLELVRLPKYIDAVIPHGMGGLRRAVLEQARVPVIGYDGGASHVYVDGDADIPLAQTIAVNSKIQDPTASNAADTILIHQKVVRHLLPGLLRRFLEDFKVDVFGCPKTISLMGIMEMTGHKGITPAKEEHWGQKFQSLTVAIKVMKDMEEALEHIAAYGPGHTDTIVTRDYDAAMSFVQQVNSSAVLVNSSTRVHSGPELGLGPEIGMSTMSFHRRGPLVLNTLTSEKYVGFGSGHLRQPHPVPEAYEDAMMMSPKF